jgi:CubicO group peptidase (beta-lactamase class C family)
MNYFRLEQCIEEHMDRARVPALALAVVNEREILYARSFGLTSVEEGGAPVSPRTLFRIGSVTKPLVGTAVMRLVEDGQLDLDRPLNAYVDWLRFSMRQAEERITLRMLLSHTSGLPADSRSGASDADGLERYVREQIPHYSFIAPPGRLYSYANAGFSLAGYIAQVVTGKRFADLMQQLVFDPLEMKHTTFDPQVVLTYPFALPHILRDEQLRVLHHISYGQAIAPAGGAYSTVLDLAHFAMMHLQRGRFHDRQLLPSSSVLQMHTQQVIRYLPYPAGYGLSFEQRIYRGIPCIGHSGSMSTFSCQLMLVPEQKLAFVLMVNRISFIQRLVSVLLDHLLGRSEAAVGPSTNEPERTLWPRYLGSFLGARTGLAVISVEDDHLVLELNGQRLSLKAYSASVYIGYWPGSDIPITVGFILDDTGPVRSITIDEKLCERFEADPLFSPNPLTWLSYGGIYKQENTEETITIQVTNEHLVLRLYDNDDNVKEGVCIPISATRFTWAGGLIEFQVAEDGTVPALTAMKVYEFKRLEEENGVQISPLSRWSTSSARRW